MVMAVITVFVISAYFFSLIPRVKSPCNVKVAETQALHAWWATAGASSEGKSLTQARSAGGGVRDTALTSRSTLETIKEGNLGHSEKGDFVTV